MIKQYRTDDSILHEISDYEDGCWIQMIKPSIAESQQIAAEFDIDIADVRAALDDEESSRIELEDGYTLILVDIPTREVRNERDTYTTIPLGIILCDEVIITVCAEDTSVLQYFTEHRVRDFSTKKRMPLPLSATGTPFSKSSVTYSALSGACIGDTPISRKPSFS